ncbi:MULTISPECIES: carotenoid oxygenase family protein [unclassified Nocardia]|uniref:carotenoid oxygenase family protein n=1 Tax=unclassified Nocardia TaxID=2637762 RepID=UPI001CE40540|nr:MULTISPECIES: carotenoid oxygenase family protein [unclassified Nocardia]
MSVETEPSTYLTGLWEPVTDEIDAVRLEVIGALPKALTGRYFRNGPNAKPGTTYDHAWSAPGMLHGIRIADGQAQWYRNRWIRTSFLENPIDGGQQADAKDLTNHNCNPGVLHHGGKIFTTADAGLPYEIGPEMNTVGACDFGNRLHTPMNTHPKVDPVTGELHFIGATRTTTPYLTYHVLSPDNRLVRTEVIDIPEPAQQHDMGITEHYIIFYDHSVLTDATMKSYTTAPFSWSDTKPARIGVMPRGGTSADVIWFAIEPTFVLHTANAHEDAQGRVVVEINRVTRENWDLGFARLGGASKAKGALDMRNPVPESYLHRWVLDPKTGKVVSSQQLDDRAIEFPTINNDHVGRDHRYVYSVAYPRHDSRDNSYSIVKYDVVTGTNQALSFSDSAVPGEADFAAAPDGTGEDEGWLISLIHPVNGDPAELWVMEATDITGTPVARVKLPRRVPYGFHANWIPDSDL